MSLTATARVDPLFRDRLFAAWADAFCPFFRPVVGLPLGVRLCIFFARSSARFGRFLGLHAWPLALAIASSPDFRIVAAASFPSSAAHASSRLISRSGAAAIRRAFANPSSSSLESMYVEHIPAPPFQN